MVAKIRILSFQNAQNFGAVLQAYGLQQVIKSCGFEDVLFINYNPYYLRNRYFVFPPKWYKPKGGGIKNIIGFYVDLPFKKYNRWKKNWLFNKSRKRLISQTTEKYYCLDDIDQVPCDFLILGSDQIWSTWITGEPDPVFYGIGNYKGLKRIISYAPSSELSTFNNPKFIGDIKKYLKRIDSISVREMTVKNILQEKYGVTSELCVDPTILCGREGFDLIANKRVIKSEYILVYSYDNGAKLVQDVINTIPNREEYEIHYISFGSSGAFETFNRYQHNEISIEVFVSLFKYASFVVTNSFHGLAFSLLYNRKFAVTYAEGKSTRCESLLSQIGAENRMVHNADDVAWNSFDFEMINQKLNVIREESKKFLLNSLNGI